MSVWPVVTTTFQRQPLTDEEIAQLIEERDVRENILDKVFDMVLGTDRPEWSSSYQYIDAVEDVREALASPSNLLPDTPDLRFHPEFRRGYFACMNDYEKLEDQWRPLGVLELNCERLDIKVTIVELTELQKERLRCKNNVSIPRYTKGE